MLAEFDEARSNPQRSCPQTASLKARAGTSNFRRHCNVHGATLVALFALPSHSCVLIQRPLWSLVDRTTSGTHNLSTCLQAAITKARAAAAHFRRCSHDHAAALVAAIPALIALDEAYHWLVYSARGAATGGVPPPSAYFSHLASAAPPGPLAAELPTTPTPPGPAAVEGGTPNPLLTLLAARTAESEAYFGGRAASPVTAFVPTGMGAGVTTGERATLKATDPVCDPVLAAWRDSVRTFACRLYAYSVPNAAALQVRCAAHCLLHGARACTCR